MVIVLIGPPGAGKGTQGRLLNERSGWPHISSGDLFRMPKEESGTAEELREVISSGRLLPHELVMKTVRERISQRDCEGGYILDGFPRTTDQARMLEAVAEQQGKQVIAILISVPKDMLERRIDGRRSCPVCGEVSNVSLGKNAEFCRRHPEVHLIRRGEDDLDKFRNRLRDYEELTVPVIDYYESSSRLRRFDGTIDVRALHNKIYMIVSGEQS